jgi:hypothetical protein
MGKKCPAYTNTGTGCSRLILATSPIMSSLGTVETIALTIGPVSSQIPGTKRASTGVRRARGTVALAVWPILVVVTSVRLRLLLLALGTMSRA